MNNFFNKIQFLHGHLRVVDLKDICNAMVEIYLFHEADGTVRMHVGAVVCEQLGINVSPTIKEQFRNRLSVPKPEQLKIVNKNNVKFHFTFVPVFLQVGMTLLHKSREAVGSSLLRLNGAKKSLVSFGSFPVSAELLLNFDPIDLK